MIYTIAVIYELKFVLLDFYKPLGESSSTQIYNVITQLTFTCSKSAIETLEKGVKVNKS